MDQVQMTKTRSGREIAFRKRGGSGPTLLFLPGYASDMDGAKAQAIDGFAADDGLPCVRLDYSGTGSSPGDFAEGTLDRWLEDALDIADEQAPGPLIAIGSSMGAWIALHIALRRTDRVAGLLGIAAAPDFTQWGFTEGQKQVIARERLLEEESAYGPEPKRIHRDFWLSGQEMRLLEEPIAIDCPVRLVQGAEDPEVPGEVAIRLMNQLRSADVQLTTVKGSGHRLSETHEIQAILNVLAGLVETCA